MALHDVVFPATLNLLRTITDVNGVLLLKGVSEGVTESIPESPWCWLEFEGFEHPGEEGADLEATDWRLIATLFWQLATDRGYAETSFITLIEPIRAAVRAHVKMGYATVARADIPKGDAGYTMVNGIWYRTIAISFAVREKIAVHYGA